MSLDEATFQPVVLCIDDEPNITKALERVLHRFGCRVVQASSGPEGLVILEQARVNVVICDEAMPGMCGVEVLRRAKAIAPEAARVLLTAHCSDQDVVIAAVNEGEIFRLLPKPWLEEELHEAVTAALGMEPRRWSQQQRRVEMRLREGEDRCASDAHTS